MIVDVTVEHIEVIKQDVVFLLSCKREDGKQFSLQFCENLKELKGKTIQEIKNHLLQRVGKMVKENVEADTEIDEQGKWKHYQDYIGKVFTIDTNLVTDE